MRSWFASTQSRRLSSHRLPPAKPIASQAGCAARTRATASATDSGESISTSRITDPSTGRWTGNVSAFCGSSAAPPFSAAAVVVSGWVADSMLSLVLLGRRDDQKRRLLRPRLLLGDAVHHAVERSDVD